VCNVWLVSKLANKKILVVDDEPDLLSILQELLEGDGAQVIQATNGDEALALIQKNPVDIVVSDIRMPNGNGMELLQTLRKRDAHNPIVLFITAFSDVAPSEIYAQGAQAVLIKPFDPNFLTQEITRLLTEPAKRWNRKYERISTSAKDWSQSSSFQSPISVKIQLAPHESLTLSRALNIGQGGMFIQDSSSILPQVGQRISFEIETAAEKLEGHGTVRWVRSQPEGSLLPGYGIEFADLTDSSIATMVRILSTLKGSQYIPDGNIS
jgi:twitching motility two-component system response regulator PilH